MDDLNNIVRDSGMVQLRNAILAIMRSNEYPLTSAELYTKTRAQYPSTEDRTANIAIGELVRDRRLRAVIRPSRVTRFNQPEESSENSEPGHQCHSGCDPRGIDYIPK